MKTLNSKFIKRSIHFLLHGSLISCFYIALELLFHFLQGLEISGRLLYPIVFSLPLGFLIAAICSFLPRKGNLILSMIAMAIPVVWASVQTCYAHVFQTYMEVNKIFMGGDVAANFGDEMKDAIIGSIPSILVYLALAVACFLLLYFKIRPKKKPVSICLMGIAFAALLHLGCYGLLYAEGTGAYAPISMYKQNPGILDNNMTNFGLMTSLRLDLNSMLFERPSSSVDEPFQSENTDILNPVKPSGPADSSTTQPGTENNGNTEDTTPTDPPVTDNRDKNILDIDFSTLISGESDSGISSIHKYVSSQSGSNTNRYTGYFEGYNLIMICAESFTSYMISEELTPTLYKMSNNGFVFDNFYGTFKSVTTNGEFAFCTGLMPNTVGKQSDLKTNSTFLLSKDKYMPYCMGNVFHNMGAKTYAYHGNNGDYYHRQETHVNMGYDVDEADKSKNPMVFQNRDIVDSLSVSSHVKAYIAANLELENMMTQLLKGLEEAGCLENTVIVLTNDHYPYGLSDKEFRELASFTGKTVESTYGIYKNSFICYNAGMTEKVVVDTPCCTVDILPTLLNLFGVDYDSRLLAGTDVLDTNSFHVAMLYNQSFITDKIKYNTANGKITYLVDKDTVSQEYIDACVKYVKNKFEISLQIVSNDYYKIIYDFLGR